MSAKAKYWLLNILDFIAAYGGTTGAIVINYVSENSAKYKITFTGIILIIAMLFTCKHIFEKSYRDKMDTYLQALASATDTAVKEEINKNIDSLKVKNDVYQKALLLLPFAIIYLLTYLGEKELNSLRGTTGVLLISLGAGAVCNVLKKPLYNQLKIEKITKKALK